MNARLLFRFREWVPVLIIERVQAGKRLGVYKRYRNKLLFIGKLPVLRILMVGLCSYMSFFGWRHYSVVENELFSIFTHAKIDEMPYQIVDFFQKKGQLIIYVMTKR